MNDLMASALQQGTSSDQTTPETSSVDINQFPRNGWNAADVKSCLGYTDVEYSNLYQKVEDAMRSADLIEASLTGQRKIKLFAVLDAVLPHDSLPTLPDDVRIKALHQLAIKVNGNVKKRSGHAHHRKRPGIRPPPATVASTETRRSLPTPAANRPNPTILHTPQPAPQPAPQLAPQIVDVGQYHSGLGSMLLLAERDDNTQSTCSLKHIARNVRPGAPIAVDTVSFDAWNSILKRDGVIRSPDDNVTITWKWGERQVRVPNERVLRSVVDFMSTHGGFIDFRVESATSGKQNIFVESVLYAY